MAALRWPVWFGQERGRERRRKDREGGGRKEGGGVERAIQLKRIHFLLQMTAVTNCEAALWEDVRLYLMQHQISLTLKNNNAALHEIEWEVFSFLFIVAV